LTRDDVTQLLAILTEAYPNHTVGEPAVRVAVWYEVLAPYDNADIVEATLGLIRDGERFQPTPARILAARRDLARRRFTIVGTAIDYGHEQLPTFEEGIEIAKRAFEAEQRRRFPDREPNWALFGKFASALVPRPQPPEEEAF